MITLLDTSSRSRETDKDRLTEIPVKPKSGYLPSLDGWRAIAILGVMMTHDQPWVVLGHSNIKWKGFGGWGVHLFFAISGILICTRILEEEKLLGRFRLKSFYLRRLFRIQPAALAYLATIAFLTGVGVLHEHWHFWFGALLLYENFLFHQEFLVMMAAGIFTAAFWTLAVEEHFYILLSLFLYFVKRNRALILAGTIVALIVAERFAKVTGRYSFDTSTRRTYWVLQYLILPAILALLLRSANVHGLVKRALAPWVAFLGTFVLLVLAHGGMHDFWNYRTLDNNWRWFLFMPGLWVVATMHHPLSWTTRLLEWAPLRYIGRLSYSIYLWHVLFFGASEPATRVTWPPLVFLSHRPLKYAATLLVASLSYHLVEKRFIRLGYRVAPPVSFGHADLNTGRHGVARTTT
jgi:peptidoglycan/LPS O-acetylase OafA/YrhL